MSKDISVMNSGWALIVNPYAEVLLKQTIQIDRQSSGQRCRLGSGSKNRQSK